jgi:hypothetical protein
MVSCGIQRDALKGEDAAYSHVDLAGAELLDCLGVPVDTTEVCGPAVTSGRAADLRLRWGE